MNRITVGDNGKFHTGVRNNITNLFIPFPVMPEGVSENVSANFTQQDIIGASRPRIVYASTSAKTISLSLKNLTDDYVAEGFTSLLQYVRALQALTYPMYRGGIVVSPDAILYLGADRMIPCVCTNVSVSWGSVVKEQQITTCSVDMTFLMTRQDVPGATEIQDKE